jgi:hypothetical protein
MNNRQREFIFGLLIENKLMLQGFEERARSPSLAAKYKEELELNKQSTLAFSKLLRDS